MPSRASPERKSRSAAASSASMRSSESRKRIQSGSSAPAAASRRRAILAVVPAGEAGSGRVSQQRPHQGARLEQSGGLVGAAVIERDDEAADRGDRVQIARDVRGGVARRQQAGDRRRRIAARRELSRPGDQAFEVEVPGTVLGGEHLPVTDHVVAVERDPPARRDLGDQRGAGLVLGRRTHDVERLAPVLELDPDAEAVDAAGSGVARDRGARIEHPARVPGGVRLVDELRQPAVEPDEVVGADPALGPLEPARRGIEAAVGRVHDDRPRPLTVSTRLMVRRRATLGLDPVRHRTIVGRRRSMVALLRRARRSPPGRSRSPARRPRRQPNRRPRSARRSGPRGC